MLTCYQTVRRKEGRAWRRGVEAEERLVQDRRDAREGREDVGRARGGQEESGAVPEAVRGVLGRHRAAEARG